MERNQFLVMDSPSQIMIMIQKSVESKFTLFCEVHISSHNLKYYCWHAIILSKNEVI
jgi:hypothetical protein